MQSTTTQMPLPVAMRINDRIRQGQDMPCGTGKAVISLLAAICWAAAGGAATWAAKNMVKSNGNVALAEGIIGKSKALDAIHSDAVFSIDELLDIRQNVLTSPSA